MLTGSAPQRSSGGPLPGFPAANFVTEQLIQAGYPGASDEALALMIRQAVLDAGTVYRCTAGSKRSCCADNCSCTDEPTVRLSNAQTHIVCLQPEAELGPLPAYMGGSVGGNARSGAGSGAVSFDSAALQRQLPSPLEWLHFPIHDGGVPADDDLRALLERCLALLAKGGVLLVHCMGVATRENSGWIGALAWGALGWSNGCSSGDRWKRAVLWRPSSRLITFLDGFGRHF